MRIFCFCIPAHGHTNPMLPVAAELVRRGHQVRFYSFAPFAEKIRSTGAAYVSCDGFLSELTEREEAGLKRVSATAMSVQDLRITRAMDGFLRGEFETIRPDVVYSDSVCFWGKLNAWKYQVPLVVSTSTFAFNQLSSRYMKNSPGEMADLVLGLPVISKELKRLEPLGYHVKSVLSLVQNDNDTDTVVYTSRRFQPYADSFTDHFAFVGPSVFSRAVPEKDEARPLVYISLGTVLHNRPDFYRRCFQALGGLPVRVVVSCGAETDLDALGDVPENVQLFHSVDQPEVLSKASVFLTHCGMNSVSESLYMAAPMVLYPQTNEQQAVARRVAELGAGTMLRDDSAEGIRAAVQELLRRPDYAAAARLCSEDFRSCSGPAGAADFLESAPHPSDGVDPLRELNRAGGRFQALWWLAVLSAGVLAGRAAGWSGALPVGLLGGVLSGPVGKAVQRRQYEKLARGRAEK